MVRVRVRDAARLEETGSVLRMLSHPNIVARVRVGIRFYFLASHVPLPIAIPPTVTLAVALPVAG